ncbi:hypothetical protein ES703_110738 [subsurface metagenome]
MSQGESLLLSCKRAISRKFSSVIFPSVVNLLALVGIECSRMRSETSCWLTSFALAILCCIQPRDFSRAYSAQMSTGETGVWYSSFSLSNSVRNANSSSAQSKWGSKGIALCFSNFIASRRRPPAKTSYFPFTGRPHRARVSSKPYFLMRCAKCSMSAWHLVFRVLNGL